MSDKKTEKFLITAKTTIKQAMRRMAEIGEKGLFVVDSKGKLIGSLSDGDIRKYILKGKGLNEKVKNVFNPHPRFVPEHYDMEAVKRLMLDKRIESVPVVNLQGVVKDMLVWGEVFDGKLPKYKEPFSTPIMIMAGGKGTRLDPFTRILPKPLIPIGDKPVIELIMDKFNAHGIRKFYVSINHKARMIKSYFEESGSKYEIIYIEEKEPLGTAGSLRLLGRITKPLIVTNSDILIDMDYSELVRFHANRRYDLTMVVSLKHFCLPYGVCDLNAAGTLKSIKEKPEYDFLVNTGMYVVNPSLLPLIPKNKHFDFTELMVRAKSRGHAVGIFPVHEAAWTDVGQWEEYKRALKMLGDLT